MALLRQGRLSLRQAQTLRAAMNAAFPDAEVTGFEALIPSMPNSPDDRHVAALAVHAGASLIVTANLKHFRKLPEGLVAAVPDDFLVSLACNDPALIDEILKAQSRALRAPSISVPELLEGLRASVPRFVALMAPRHPR